MTRTKMHREKRERDSDRDPEAKAFIKTFRAFVHSHYGPRCKTIYAGCHRCEMWAVFDLINTMVR